MGYLLLTASKSSLIFQRLIKYSHLWSNPYEGDGKTMMAAYSVPFYREIEGKREFTVVVIIQAHLS